MRSVARDRGVRPFLSFAVATDNCPDILLADEIFSGGDKDFSRKARDRMLELIKDTRILLFVSHNLKQIA